MAKKPKEQAPVNTRPVEKRKPKAGDDLGGEAFSRVFHRIYLRDGKQTYFQEQAVLAALLHTNDSVQRNRADVEYVQKMMDDHNLD